MHKPSESIEVDSTNEALAARVAELEARLADSQAESDRYRLAALAASDALLDCDLITGTIWRNHNHRDIFGEESGDTVDWWRERLHPEDYERVAQTFKDALADHQGELALRCRFRRADGRYALLSMHCYVVYDAERALRIVSALTDITEQLEADNQIRRLAAYPRENPNPILESDDGGRIQYRNPAANRLVQALSCDIEELLPPNHAEMVKQALTMVSPNPMAKLRYSNRLFSWHYYPIPSANVVHVYGVDITERHEREAALRESESRFRSMANSAPVMIWLADEHAQMMWFNQHALDFTGSALEDNLGTGVFQYIHADDREAASRMLQELVSQRRIVQTEIRLRRPSGQYRWCIINGSPRYTPDGRFVGVIGTASDIQAQKTTQEELLLSRERMSFIINHLPAIVWTVDREQSIITSGGAGLVELGIDAKQMIGKRLKDTLDPDNHFVVDLVQRALDHGESATYSTQFMGRHFRTSLEPLHDSSGQVTTVIGLSHDMTRELEAESERREFEAKLQQAQKLESLGVLAGGIAHDFNNLLAGILGNAGLAMMEISQFSPVLPILQNIETAAKRASELTHQMLAYSGRGRFMVEAIDLNEKVSEMLNLLSVSLSKKATLELNLHSQPALIQGDAAQMQQVIMNLITNASDALGEASGTIRLSTGVMHADEDYLRQTYLDEDLPAGDYAWLEVADTGQGMAADTLKRIFDPFFSTKFTGRGLGLAAILGIIRGHKGAIDVRSELGVGTTFRVLLPRHHESPKVAPAEASPDAAAAKATGTILVVDDEETIRTVARMILMRFGYQVIVAETGGIAVEIIEARPEAIDAVLLDMTMPQMSGEDTTRAIKAIAPTLPILLMSGYSEQEAQARFAGGGIAGFLHKPFRAQELRSRLHAILTEARGG